MIKLNTILKNNNCNNQSNNNTFMMTDDAKKELIYARKVLNNLTFFEKQERDFSFIINSEIMNFQKDYKTQLRRRKDIKEKLLSKQNKLDKIIKEIDSLCINPKSPIEKFNTKRESKLSIISLVKKSEKTSPHNVHIFNKKDSKPHQFLEESRKSIKANLNTSRKFSVVHPFKFKYKNSQKHMRGTSRLF